MQKNVHKKSKITQHLRKSSSWFI